jgi:hypothetical protein
VDIPARQWNDANGQLECCDTDVTVTDTDAIGRTLDAVTIPIGRRVNAN